MSKSKDNKKRGDKDYEYVKKKVQDKKRALNRRRQRREKDNFKKAQF